MRTHCILWGKWFEEDERGERWRPPLKGERWGPGPCDRSWFQYWNIWFKFKLLQYLIKFELLCYRSTTYYSHSYTVVSITYFWIQTTLFVWLVITPVVFFPYIQLFLVSELMSKVPSSLPKHDPMSSQSVLHPEETTKHRTPSPTSSPRCKLWGNLYCLKN